MKTIEIKRLSIDLIESPDLIFNQTDQDLEAVSDLLWKFQKCIDNHLKAKKTKSELFSGYDEDDQDV